MQFCFGQKSTESTQPGVARFNELLDSVEQEEEQEEQKWEGIKTATTHSFHKQF